MTDRWSYEEIGELGAAMLASGDSAALHRILSRLEAGDLSVRQAIDELVRLVTPLQATSAEPPRSGANGDPDTAETSYTVRFQFLSADPNDGWVHEARTVTANNSKDALALVTHAVEREHLGRKCVVKQISKVCKAS